MLRTIVLLSFRLLGQRARLRLSSRLCDLAMVFCGKAGLVQKCLHFWRAHFRRMTLVVEKNEATRPIDVAFLCAYTIVTSTNRITRLVEEFLGFFMPYIQVRCFYVVNLIGLIVYDYLLYTNLSFLSTIFLCTIVVSPQRETKSDARLLNR